VQFSFKSFSLIGILSISIVALSIVARLTTDFQIESVLLTARITGYATLLLLCLLISLKLVDAVPISDTARVRARRIKTHAAVLTIIAGAIHSAMILQGLPSFSLFENSQIQSGLIALTCCVLLSALSRKNTEAFRFAHLVRGALPWIAAISLSIHLFLSPFASRSVCILAFSLAFLILCLGLVFGKRRT